MLRLKPYQVGNESKWLEKHRERLNRDTVEEWSRKQERIWEEQGLIGKRSLFNPDNDDYDTEEEDEGQCVLCIQPIPKYHG